MGVTFYYIRTSTEEQQFERQLPDGVDEDEEFVFIDHGTSGRTLKRDAYNHMCSLVEAGDKIVFTDISRHGRSLTELLSEADRLTKEGIILEYTAQNIVLDASKPKSDVSWIQFNLMSVIAQAQVDLARENSISGIRKQQELDKSRSDALKRYKGGKKTVSRKDVAKLYVEKGYNKSEISRLMGIDVKTVRKCLREQGIS